MSLLTFAIDKMSEATQFYSVGEYDKALEIYNSLIDEDLSSVALFYNAGNTNFKLGNIGKSILCYERALVLDPNNEDVKYNLELAQSKVTDNIEVIKPFIFTRIYNSIIETKSSNSWAVLSLVCLVVALACFFVYFFVREYNWLRKTTFFSSHVVFLCFILFTIFAVSQKNKVENRNNAIVMDATVSVKGSPDSSAIDLFVIHEGTKVEIVETLGNWIQIKLQDGNKGWLISKSVEVI